MDVCTWNNGHAPVTIAAAKAGKHILCEKPFADSLEHALEAKAAVEEAGVRFLLGVPSRFNPQNALVREMTDKGEFGEIYYAKTSYLRRRGTPTGWFTDKRVSGGGPILDIAVHRIDAAWYMMGNPKPVRVSAAVSNRLGEFQTKGIQRRQGTPCPDNKNDTEDFGAGVIHLRTAPSCFSKPPGRSTAPTTSIPSFTAPRAASRWTPDRLRRAQRLSQRRPLKPRPRQEL
ncbi:MAG: Gfo/Idh/MocA family protein [Acutalibacteraceae bacterium]